MCSTARVAPSSYQLFLVPEKFSIRFFLGDCVSICFDVDCQYLLCSFILCPPVPLWRAICAYDFKPRLQKDIKWMSSVLCQLHGVAWNHVDLNALRSQHGLSISYKYKIAWTYLNECMCVHELCFHFRFLPLICCERFQRLYVVAAYRCSSGMG